MTSLVLPPPTVRFSGTIYAFVDKTVETNPRPDLRIGANLFNLQDKNVGYDNVHLYNRNQFGEACTITTPYEEGSDKDITILAHLREKLSESAGYKFFDLGTTWNQWSNSLEIKKALLLGW